MSIAVRRRLSVLAILAIACLPLLPPAHVHRAGIEGRATALVHAHPLRGADGTHIPGRLALRSAPTHGNHELAIFLTLDCGWSSSSHGPSLVLATSAFLLHPVLPPTESVGVLSAHAIHGPPVRAWLTRGPPLHS